MGTRKKPPICTTQYLVDNSPVRPALEKLEKLKRTKDVLKRNERAGQKMYVDDGGGSGGERIGGRCSAQVEGCFPVVGERT